MSAEHVTDPLAVASDPAGGRAGRRDWLALGVLVLPALLLFMMLTVLFLAMPHMAADLRPTASQALWILDVYGFLMAGFLVLMGAVADRFGHRTLLVAGAALFGAVSVVAASTTDPTIMIAGRAVLGVAAAAQMPATLGLIFTIFRDAGQRAVAIGVWAAGISAGVALGPLVGGLLLEFAGWRATFLIAVPVMAIVVAAAPVLLPPHRAGTSNGRIDVGSAVLLLAALLPLVYGIKTAATGSSPVVSAAAAAVAAGLGFGAWFVARQLGSAQPLLDLRLFANRTVAGALGVFVLSATALGGVYLLFTQYLQLVQGLSPIRAGLAILPAALVLVAVATTAPRLARRHRPGYVIAAGLAVQVVGYLLLTLLGPGTALIWVIAAFVVVYPAVAPSMALTTDLVVGSVPPEKAGAASGLASTVNDLGLSLGITVIGSISAATYTARVESALPADLPATIATSARQGIDTATAAAAGAPAELAVPLLAAARDAFTAALHTGAAVAAGIVAVGAVLAAGLLRHVPATAEARHEHVRDD